MSDAPAIVVDAAGVDEVVAAARSAGTCALDTEFLWEKSYAPRLCLVQIAVGDRIWLIDPIAGAPLEPIGALIADPAVRTLMHAPSADLVAFGRHYLGNPDLVARIRLGIPLARSENKTWYGGGAKGYTDYPLATSLDG